MGKQRRRTLSELEIIARYPKCNIIKNSLVYDEELKKQYVYIKCSWPWCLTKRKVWVSDLSQVDLCQTHIIERRNNRRQNKRHEKH